MTRTNLHPRSRPLILTLDGQAACGKSATAKALSRRLRLPLLDTGAIYRSVALLAHEQGRLTDPQPVRSGLLDSFLVDLARHLQNGSPLRFAWGTGQQRVFIGAREVTEAIRTPVIDHWTPIISPQAPLRESLLDLQRSYGQGGAGLIAVGRDAGSVIFPDANLKIYLTANLRVRTQRRWEELMRSQPGITRRAVRDSLVARDQQDRRRDSAPLVKPEGAVAISTTHRSIAQVVGEIIARLHRQDTRLI